MLIYGKQVIHYLLEQNPQTIQTLYLAKEVEKKLYNKVMAQDFEVKRIPNDAANKMCKSNNHQGFLADIKAPELKSFTEIKDANFVLVLCNLTDVGNIGAIIRTAYALGVEAIIITAKSFNLEGVIRTSSGAALSMNIVHHANLYDLLNDLKTSGFTCYGAAMEGENIKTVQIGTKRALILGSEGEGIPNRALKKLDQLVSIPMKHDFDSLNVSAAAAILIDRMN